jgi:hypothetical protein
MPDVGRKGELLAGRPRAERGFRAAWHDCARRAPLGACWLPSGGPGSLARCCGDASRVANLRYSALIAAERADCCELGFAWLGTNGACTLWVRAIRGGRGAARPAAKRRAVAV